MADGIKTTILLALFLGCEIFWVGSGAIDGWESELRKDISDGLLLEGGATGCAQLFSPWGNAARTAGATIDGWDSALWTDISDGLLVEGDATGRDHLFSPWEGAAPTAGGTIEGWDFELWTDISKGLLLEGHL